MSAKVKIVGDDWHKSFPARHKFSKLVVEMLNTYHTSVCDRYAHGETMAEIAAADGTNIPRIRSLLIAEGTNIHRGRRKQPGLVWEAEAHAAYKRGEPVQAIAARVGITRQRVYNVARARGWERENQEK